MNISDILARIDARRAEIGMSERNLAVVAGSADTIRNWRRAARDGRQISPRLATLEALAAELRVSVDYLTSPSTEPVTPRNPEKPTRGFREGAVPFEVRATATPDDAPDHLLRQIFGAKARTPSSLKLLVDLPAFGLLANDVVVIDLARLPEPGELALVTIADDGTGTSASGVFRYLPPFLAAGDARQASDLLRLDQPGVTARAAVIGSIRGI